MNTTPALPQAGAPVLPDRRSAICPQSEFPLLAKSGNSNPAKPRKKTHVTPVFTAEEKAWMFAEAETSRDRLILLLLLRAGLRIGEVGHLQAQQIDLAARRLMVVDGKTGDRVVPLAADLAVALEKWLAGRSIGPVILSRNRRAGPRGLTARMLRLIVKEIARRAGLERRVHPHQFRHTFATDLSDRGVPVRDIMELLGHRKIATTQIYLHCSVGRLQAAMDSLMLPAPL